MTEKVDSARRGFLTRFSKPTQTLIEAPTEATPRLAPRPPRALDELLFLEKCTGCGQCQSACTMKVIDMIDHRPQLNLDFNHCTLCDECTKACPTGALNAVQPLKTELRPSFSDNCQNYLFNECKLCRFACPHQAILIEADQLPNVDSSLCEGCGICRVSCPFGAITMSL